MFQFCQQQLAKSKSPKFMSSVNIKLMDQEAELFDCIIMIYDWHTSRMEEMEAADAERWAKSGTQYFWHN